MIPSLTKKVKKDSPTEALTVTIKQEGGKVFFFFFFKGLLTPTQLLQCKICTVYK